jgi:ATP-dependent DNA helicase RecG
MTSKTLRARIQGGQDKATEFVARIDSLDRVGKSVCAFLNSSGGTILVGVRSDTSISGVGPNAEAQAFSLETKLQRSISPSSMFTVTVDDVDGDSVILVEVPAGKDLPYVYDGNIYVRDGLSSKLADAGALRSLIRQQIDEPERWERRLSPSMTEEDLSLDEVGETMAQGVERVGLNQDIASEPLEFLRRMSLLRFEGFTQGADVLFAQSPERRHPQCRVQFVAYEHNQTSDEYSDYRWFEGPLTKVALEIFERLSSEIRYRAKFQASSVTRDRQPSYSMGALREALVNALVHRDYTSYSGGVKVSVYPDRIEFWNSGQLPDELSVNDLKKVHPSIPTNPDIAHIFYLRGLMERVGRGTLKIIESSEGLGAKRPKWESRKSGVTLTVYAANGVELDLSVLNDRQQQLLARLEFEESFSPGDYQAEIASEVSPRQARRDLSELEELGILVRTGAGPNTRYRRFQE